MPAPPLPFRIVAPDDEDLAAFIQWEGPPPTLVQPQLQTPSRTGTRNVGLIDTGERQGAVDVQLTSWWSDLDTGYSAHNAHQELVGIVPLQSLIWNEIDLDDYNQKICILQVQLISLQNHPRLYAPKWELNYAPGARLVEKFSIQYFEVDPPA